MPISHQKGKRKKEKKGSSIFVDKRGKNPANISEDYIFLGPAPATYAIQREFGQLLTLYESFKKLV